MTIAWIAVCVRGAFRIRQYGRSSAEANSAQAGIRWRGRGVPIVCCEVLNQLRNDSGKHPCAIVILTAYGGEELAVRAMKAGASDYLPKGWLSADTLPRTVFMRLKNSACTNKSSSRV